jgi:hypothetical protein
VNWLPRAPMLGKKTMEAQILREAVEVAREKSGLRACTY